MLLTQPVSREDLSFSYDSVFIINFKTSALTIMLYANWPNFTELSLSYCGVSFMNLNSDVTGLLGSSLSCRVSREIFPIVFLW